MLLGWTLRGVHVCLCEGLGIFIEDGLEMSRCFKYRILHFAFMNA